MDQNNMIPAMRTPKQGHQFFETPTLHCSYLHNVGVESSLSSGASGAQMGGIHLVPKWGLLKVIILLGYRYRAPDVERLTGPEKYCNNLWVLEISQS